MRASQANSLQSNNGRLVDLERRPNRCVNNLVERRLVETSQERLGRPKEVAAARHEPLRVQKACHPLGYSPDFRLRE